eukprot:6482315-Amphidinium_carterae.1
MCLSKASQAGSDRAALFFAGLGCCKQGGLLMGGQIVVCERSVVSFKVALVKAVEQRVIKYPPSLRASGSTAKATCGLKTCADQALQVSKTTTLMVSDRRTATGTCHQHRG